MYSLSANRDEREFLLFHCRETNRVIAMKFIGDSTGIGDFLNGLLCKIPACAHTRPTVFMTIA